MASKKGITSVHRRILDVLREHPGIDIHGIRSELGLSTTEQQHLDKRIRELRASYDVPYDRKQRGYFLKGERTLCQFGKPWSGSFVSTGA